MFAEPNQIPPALIVYLFFHPSAMSADAREVKERKIIGHYGVSVSDIEEQLVHTDGLTTFPKVLLALVSSYLAPTIMPWRLLKNLYLITGVS